MSVTRSPIPINTLDSIAQIVIFGNSIAAPGGGASAGDRDLMTRLAHMMGAKEYNYALGGSVISWHQDITNNEYGVYPQVYQNHKRPVRPASTLNADPAVGATSFTLAHSNTSATGLPFSIPETMIHVGTGDPGATGGEIMRLVTAQSGTGITAGQTENWEIEGAAAGAVRNHATGDPVFEVPTQYLAGNTLYLVCEAHNHLGAHGLGSLSEGWYKDSLRSILARLRCAEVYEPDNRGALQFSGSSTWGAGNPTIVAATSSSSGQGTGGARVGAGVTSPANTSATVTFHLPNNFPGGTAVMAFLAGGTTGTGVWTFTVDGVSAGTLQPSKSITTSEATRAHNTTYCKRFTNLAPGRHQIVAQMTTHEANHYFDWAGIEAPEAPITVVFKPHRLYDYGFFGTGWPYGHIPLKLNAQANAGATSIVVPQTWKASARQVAATPNALTTQGPDVGDTITIAPGTANEEIRVVTSVTGSGPYTINFSGGGLANTHAINTAVHAGIKDSDLATVSSWIDSVADEFDRQVVRFNPDPAIQKSRSLFSPSDLVHWNDEGHARAAEALYTQLKREIRISPTVSSRLSRPIPQPSRDVQFLANSTAVAWTNMTAALCEFPLATAGPGSFRRVADLSRAYEARLGCIQTVIGSANSKMRIQFSLDGGTTWFYLFRKMNTVFIPTRTDFTEPTLAADVTPEIAVGAALGSLGGFKGTFWAPIYPDALQDNVMLRLVGIGGDGVADPAFMSIWLELR